MSNILVFISLPNLRMNFTYLILTYLAMWRFLDKLNNNIHLNLGFCELLNFIPLLSYDSKDKYEKIEKLISNKIRYLSI